MKKVGQSITTLLSINPSPRRRLVLPGGLVEVEFPLHPQAIGRFTLLASMHCDQLTDVRGWTEIRVADGGDEGGNHR